MGRFLGIDYGEKRVGIAVTDLSKIISSSLTTIPTDEAMKFLKDYCTKEPVEIFVIGDPKTLRNEDNKLTPKVNAFILLLQKEFPLIPVHKVDERFTSKMASSIIFNSGIGKMKRQNKELIDKVSAAIILQTFLDTYPK